MIQLIKFNFVSPSKQKECRTRIVEHEVGRTGWIENEVLLSRHILLERRCPFSIHTLTNKIYFAQNNNGRLTIFRRVSITVREEFRLFHIPAGFLCLDEEFLIEMNGCCLQSSGVDPGCCR